ncbi:MAG: UDP-N-acetylglucosamine 2-epimerase (non-hydrolyzing) [Candidatus Anstonellales archaeon]
MKVATFIGTRPNISKEFAMHRAFSKLGIEEVLVHTGQHYDYEMSGIFFKEFELPTPSYHLGVRKGSECEQMSKIIKTSEKVLTKEKPDMAVVYGDVTSTSAPAISAVKCRIPVAHIEAGIRDRNLYNSEESNRRIADTLSDLLFPPTKEAYQNLVNEGFSEERIKNCGDVMLDCMNLILKKMNIKPKRGDYILSTIHRQENADNMQRLSEIFEAFSECGQKVIIPLHPRTRKNLKRFGLLNHIQNSENIEVLPPLGYFEFVSLLAGADKVVTDSGGVRREAYFLHKPVIVPINIVWFPELVEAGWMKVAITKKEILDALTSFELPSAHPELFGDGHAAEKIANEILNFEG